MTDRKLEFPAWSSCLFRPSRYKVIFGGRGSGKSWSIARALVLLASERKLRILCTREFQNSISESCHELLSSQIRAMGLAHKYEIQQQGIYGANGSEFLFVGTGTSPEKIMSMEGVDICWVEQAERVSERSFEILIPTIRQRGSEIWCSFNPSEESDPVWRRFVAACPPDAVVVRVNYESNPWFPVELERERAYLAAVDPESAAHVWGGECRRNASSQIFRGKYVVESFDVPTLSGQPTWDGPYFGADWGFAADPTVLVKCWIDSTAKRLMIEHEVWGIGVELDDIPALFASVPEARDRVVRADCSRPETISHVRQRGFLRIEACEKWSGSIEDGIAFLRSFETICIHPRCRHTIEEFGLYSFKVDRLSGDVLPIPLDKNNHCIDALRYALEPMIGHQDPLWVWSRL